MSLNPVFIEPELPQQVEPALDFLAERFGPPPLNESIPWSRQRAYRTAYREWLDVALTSQVQAEHQRLKATPHDPTKPQRQWKLTWLSRTLNRRNVT